MLVEMHHVKDLAQALIESNQGELPSEAMGIAPILHESPHAARIDVLDLGHIQEKKRTVRLDPGLQKRPEPRSAPEIDFSRKFQHFAIFHRDIFDEATHRISKAQRNIRLLGQ